MRLYLTFLFGCIAFQCVYGARIDAVDPKLKIEITHEVSCHRRSRLGDNLHVHYIGHLADGKEFDNSYKRRHPVIFTVGINNVIKAWDQGLLGMCEGEKRRIIAPPELAYGDTGFDGMIPPGATLTFETELLHINLRDEL